MVRQCERAGTWMTLLVILLAIGTTVQAAEFKTGTYSATAGGVKWSVRFDDGGKAAVLKDGKAVVEATYKVTGDEIEITDVSGEMACTGDLKTGKYKWAMDAGKMTFTKVEDQCPARSSALTSQGWMHE